jgi:hypothetical protein
MEWQVMDVFPKTDNSLVLRTDFADDLVWAAVSAAIAAPVGDFRAYVTFVDDRRYDGLTIEQLLALVPEGSNLTFIFLVDGETLRHPDHPVLVVDLFHQRGRSFRVIPSEMWGVENNLSLANMDWEEFADRVDQDGVFRGFPD